MTATPEQIDVTQPPDAPDNRPPPSSDDTAMTPPDEMTEEEARLLADTMPGAGPGGD